MELAIQLFFVSNGPEKIRLEQVIGKEKGVKVEWHAEDVCRRLIHKPLHIDSKQHSLFWDNLRSGLSLGRVRVQALACVIIDNMETMLVSHYDVLVTMMEVLLDEEFYSQLDSLRELPLFILKILVSKQGLRRFVFKNLSESCRAEIDTDDLRRKSELGFELYINTVDDLFEFREFESNDTPSPSIEGRYERPLKRPKQPDEWYEAEEFLKFFPVRRGCDPRSSVISFSADSIATLLSAYSMLWTDLNRLRSTGDKTADMKSAFPMMLAFMAEDLDQQTLGRARGYFAGDQDILETVQISAQRLRSFLVGGDIIDPRFAEGRSVYGNRAQLLYEIHCSRFENDRVNRASLYNAREWSLQHVTVVPVLHFLKQLDAAAMIAGRSLRVREFLHEKDRLEYFAYRFPQGVSLFAVESSLAALCNWWDIPMLNNTAYVVVPAENDQVAIVTTPSVMLCMRMISITRAFVAGIVEPTSFWRFCVRNLVHLPPKNCPELHDIALFCTTAAVGYKLVNGHVFKSLATPGNPLFAVYRFLPAFCRYYRRMKGNTYGDLCKYVRLLLQARSSKQLTVSFSTLYLVLDILGEHPQQSEYSDLIEKINSRITRPERHKKRGYSRVFLAPRRPLRDTKRALYLHEILRATMDNQWDRPDRLQMLLDDLLVDAKLTSPPTRTPKVYVDRGIGQQRIESFAKLEERVRREEIGIPALDAELLTLAYSYYTSRGFFVPTLHDITSIDKLTAEQNETPTTSHQILPPQECTADNVREHTEHYFSANFIEFLYQCFMDTEESSGVNLSQIQTLLTTEEPPLLEVRLSNKKEALIDECFLLSRANIQHKKGSDFSGGNTCSIDDQLAQDLVTQYGQDMVIGTQVTAKMDYGKSYLECVQHLHEMLED
jgi:hypothetical protein